MKKYVIMSVLMAICMIFSSCKINPLNDSDNTQRTPLPINNNFGNEDQILDIEENRPKILSYAILEQNSFSFIFCWSLSLRKFISIF